MEFKSVLDLERGGLLSRTVALPRPNQVTGPVMIYVYVDVCNTLDHYTIYILQILQCPYLKLHAKKILLRLDLM